MKSKTMKTAGLAGLAMLVLTASGCESAQQAAAREVSSKAVDRAPYLPENDVEFENYNQAQELFDDPNSIIWCTSSFPNDSSPIFTVPIRGKLTSSSTSYFAGTNSSGVEERSVDGMFHGSPPPYRFGFTPAGVYASFEGMSAYCSSQLDSFQREQTYISVAPESDAVTEAQKQAEAAMKAGDTEKAMQLLTDATDGMGVGESK